MRAVLIATLLFAISSIYGGNPSNASDDGLAVLAVTSSEFENQVRSNTAVNNPKGTHFLEEKGGCNKVKLELLSLEGNCAHHFVFLISDSYFIFGCSDQTPVFEKPKLHDSVMRFGIHRPPIAL